MRIVPSSTISLYENIDIDDGQQIAFASRNEQATYFHDHLLGSSYPCTMVKKTGRLRVEVSGATAARANYLSFVNPDFDNKTVYAHIVDYDYVNNECVEIAYVIDYFQTWCFDVSYEDMYIDRESLSAADYAKAETNPYDPSILEFRTAENLPIGEDTERLYYTTDQTTDDIDMIMDEKISQLFPNISDTDRGVLFMIAEIDFDDLDYDQPSQPAKTWWDAMLADVAADTYGFYQDPDGVFMCGSGYSSGGYSARHLITRMKIPYYSIFIPDSMRHNNMKYSKELIQKLTTWGCVSSIINIYYLPAKLIAPAFSYADGQGGGGTIYFDASTSADRISNIRSKKLLQYPYSYIRLMSPNGDKKEIRYETFHDNQVGTNRCRFSVIMDLNGRPTMAIVPNDYKFSYATQGINRQGNYNNGIIFQQIPTMPYNIDSFLAQTAANAQQIVGNNTQEYQYDMGMKMLSEYGGALSTAEGAVNAAGNAGSGNFIGALSSALRANLMGHEADLGFKKLNLEAQMSDEAYGALSGKTTGNAVYENFKYTRPAFAANKYVPSTGDGMLNYVSDIGFLDIMLIHVTLNDQIMAAYDQYFVNYGYNSGRCGIPRVLQYIDGESAQAAIPHWEQIGGKDATYVKTGDCKVVFAMKPVANAIKSMLDNGVRFLKGSTL